MSPKPLSVDDIIAKFRIKKLTKIEGEPTYETISKVSHELYTNAATLSSPLGGGQHGHIGMVMKPALYATLSATPYVEPVAPSLTPNFDPTQIYTEIQRQQLRDDHAHQVKTFTEHNNMDAALQQLLTEAVEELYLSAKCNRFTGYLGVTTRDLLDHLLERYGNITAADLQANKDAMDEPIDVSLPIDAYFKRIEDCIQLAGDANTPFSNQQVLQTTYFAVQATGLYKDGLKEWRLKQDADKTWTNFKTLFAAEYHQLKEEQRLTTSAAGYSSMNHVQGFTEDLSSAIDNLAMATESDKNTIQELVEANKKLTETNAELVAQLKLALGNKCVEVPAPSKAKSLHDKWLAYEAKMDPEGYCWTHGYRVVRGHCSKSCTNKAAGHKDEATRQNPMGGSTRNKNWTPAQ